MMQGFTPVDSERFYRDAWPQIKKLAREAHLLRCSAESQGDYPVVAQSNWNDVKACVNAGQPVPPLLIYWGFKDDAGTSKIVLAITRSTQGNPDEYWVAPDLIVT